MVLRTNGEAQVNDNLTKTFAFSAFDLPIKYDADIDLAIQLVEKTSADMQADPVFGPKILSSIEIPGVDMMAIRDFQLRRALRRRLWNDGK